MQLGSMATNRYSAPFRDQVQGWIVKLCTVSEVIEQWLMVQNMWMYMEAVFSGGDIVKQLPAEAKRFHAIDKNYMKVRERGAARVLLGWACTRFGRSVVVVCVFVCVCMGCDATSTCSLCTCCPPHPTQQQTTYQDCHLSHRDPKRRRRVRGQRAHAEHAAAPAGAAGAVPEEPQRLPGEQAFRVPKVGWLACMLACHLVAHLLSLAAVSFLT